MNNMQKFTQNWTAAQEAEAKILERLDIAADLIRRVADKQLRKRNSGGGYLVPHLHKDLRWIIYYRQEGAEICYENGNFYVSAMNRNNRKERHYIYNVFISGSMWDICKETRYMLLAQNTVDERKEIGKLQAEMESMQSKLEEVTAKKDKIAKQYKKDRAEYIRKQDERVERSNMRIL